MTKHVSKTGRHIYAPKKGKKKSIPRYIQCALTDLEDDEIFGDVAGLGSGEVELEDEGVIEPQVDGIHYKFIQTKLTEVKQMLSSKDFDAKQLKSFWFHSDEPTSGDFVRMPDSDTFIPVSVFFFLPHLLGAKIHCPRCKGTNVILHGWPSNPEARRVVGLTRCVYVVSQRHKCKDCWEQREKEKKSEREKEVAEKGKGKEKENENREANADESAIVDDPDHSNDTSGQITKFTFTGHDPMVIAQMKEQFQEMFPFVLTHRSGCTKEVVENMRSCLARGMSVSGFRSMLKENHYRKYESCKIQYLSACERWDEMELEKKKKGSVKSFFTQGKSEKRKGFGEFNDPERYGGFIPSAKYLTDLYIISIMMKEKPLLAQMVKAPLGIAGIDHHHGMPKQCAKRMGVPLFDSLLSVINEHEQIKALFLTIGTAQEGMRHLFESICHWLKEMGNELPQIIYTDVCCKDRAFLEMVVETLTKDVIPRVKNKMGVLDTKGRVVLVNSPQLLELELGILQALMPVKPAVTYHIGFDGEWEFNTVSRTQGAMATLQIAFGEDAWVFHLPRLRLQEPKGGRPGRLPDIFKKFLEREDLIVVGKSVTGDISKLHKDYGIEIKKFEELGDLAKKRRVVSDARVSLKALCEAVLLKTLNKEARISKWESDLRLDQLQYAALDAISSLKIFKKLDELPKIGEPVTDVMIRDGLPVTVRANKDSEVVVAKGILRVISGLSVPKSRLVVQINEVVASGVKVSQYDTNGTKLSGSFEPNKAYQILRSLLKVSESEDCCISSCSSAFTSATLEEIAEEDLKHFTRVKLDPYHWFSRVSSVLDKDHPAFLDFTRSLRDAVLAIVEEDKKKLESYLESVGGPSFEQLLESSPWSVWRHVRRRIPQPTMLRERIMNVVKAFENAVDKKHELLLTDAFYSCLKKAMEHVDKGCLSDPPDVEIYLELPGSDSALPEFRGVRGTNGNEGAVHSPLQDHFGCPNAGPKLTYAFLLDFAARVNMAAAVRNRGEKDYGHFDPWMIDTVNRLSMKVGLGIEYPEWMSSEQLDWGSSPPIVIIGPWFDKNLFQPFNPDDKVEMSAGMSFLAERTGVRIPVVPVHTVEERTLYVELSKTCATTTEILEKWNKKVDGRTIFAKTYNLLDSYKEVRLNAEQRNQVRRNLQLKKTLVFPEYHAVPVEKDADQVDEKSEDAEEKAGGKDQVDDKTDGAEEDDAGAVQANVNSEGSNKDRLDVVAPGPDDTSTHERPFTPTASTSRSNPLIHDLSPTTKSATNRSKAPRLHGIGSNSRSSGMAENSAAESSASNSASDEVFKQSIQHKAKLAKLYVELIQDGKTERQIDERLKKDFPNTIGNSRNAVKEIVAKFERANVKDLADYDQIIASRPIEKYRTWFKRNCRK